MLKSPNKPKSTIPPKHYALSSQWQREIGSGRRAHQILTNKLGLNSAVFIVKESNISFAFIMRPQDAESVWKFGTKGASAK